MNGQNHSVEMLLSYHCRQGTFTELTDTGYLDAVLKGRSFWQAIEEDGIAQEKDVRMLTGKLAQMSMVSAPAVCFEKALFRTGQQEWRWLGINFVCVKPGEQVLLTITDLGEETSGVQQARDKDALTGLLTQEAFCREVERAVERAPGLAADGGFAMVYFNVLRFKAINDLFGMEAGDRLLAFIGRTLSQYLRADEIGCRISSDRFAAFISTGEDGVQRLIDRLLGEVAGYDLPFETTINAGVYTTNAQALTADAMIDRATLALSSIKGSYTVKYRYFTESLRKEMLSEHEMVGTIAAALSERQFIVYYQPQYNHSTGMLVGAEALVRWAHPERGLISPGNFIPAFEKNGFVTTLDLYVFEHACMLLRRCMERGLPTVPVAVNVSRYDVFEPDFVSKLETIRARHGVPAKYLRLELTESAFIGGAKHTEQAIRQMHECGYTVEMDDFGSGYSSLNVLKDTDVDCFKLDMEFLADGEGGHKGGTILSSVVRMAKWLGIEVIAEGVETVQQADFLRSIGCDCVQGYLYAAPMEEERYIRLLSASGIGARVPQLVVGESIHAVDFWNPDSQETLIFSNYVGGAAIFEYRDGRVEILRVNKKYLAELCMNLSEKEIVRMDLLSLFDEENRKLYLDMLERAIETGEEQECETWRTLSSACCGDEQLFVRTTARVIGRSAGTYLFYAMIRNITGERRSLEKMLDNERRFQMASEQVNIYFWEYTIATKEMRPCFRCMRDLGLPPLMTNYPESAFERGVFPPEVHDLYRSWHRQVAAGVPELEAIMPLTADRIPFRMRYSTEFDDQGRPVKAYGSAALVKDAAARPSELEAMGADNSRALQLIAQHSDRVVLLYNLATRKIRFNEELADQYGMNNTTIDALLGEGRILPESLDNARRVLRNIERGVPYGRERIRFKYRENYYCWLDFKYTTLFDEEKKPVGAFLSYVDITDEVEALARSKIDGMTGLLNRATAEAEIRARLEKNKNPGIMLLLDIDGLKEINDTYGHREGDRAIQSIAGALKGHFRASDVIGRFGGDEFAVYLEAAAENTAAISRSLKTLMHKIDQLRVGPHEEMGLHCSIGCAVQGRQGKAFDVLYRQADAALYHAKRAGKNQFFFLDEEERERGGQSADEA